MVGRSAARATSFLRTSERLMPSRAARDFNVRCTFSGTFLTWIILDMSQAYKHVLHMYNSGTIMSSSEDNIDIARTGHPPVRCVGAGPRPEYFGIANVMGNSRPVRVPL